MAIVCYHSYIYDSVTPATFSSSGDMSSILHVPGPTPILVPAMLTDILYDFRQCDQENTKFCLEISKDRFLPSQPYVITYLTR
jgi:hypothetical protein